jgi:hypothetical protein
MGALKLLVGRGVEPSGKRQVVLLPRRIGLMFLIACVLEGRYGKGGRLDVYCGCFALADLRLERLDLVAPLIMR